jgi:ABC-2 type transport system permease protein
MPIFDQGYQHWKGTLSGRGWRWLAITKQGLRGQLGGWRVRILLLLAWVPALALVCVVSLWGLFEQGSEGVLALLKPVIPPTIAADPHLYRQAIWTISYSMFFKFEVFFIMLLVVMVGPNLISRDLRFNALPLYFSRPLTRLDYFLGKLGVVAILVAAVAVVPALAAYVLGVCFSLDFTVIRDTWRLPLASGLYGLLITVSAGMLMLAFSSLSRRSLYVGIAWVGLWLISSTVASVLGGIQRGTLMKEEMARANLDWPPRFQPPPPGAPRSNSANWQAQMRAFQQVQERVERALAEAAPTDWRPICSYTANLERLGEGLLNTDAAWVKFGEAMEAPRTAMRPFALFFGRRRSGAEPAPPASNKRRFADRYVPQYPWVWSASVLAGLFGISLWTLSTRVKSLDRLR